MFKKSLLVVLVLVGGVFVSTYMSSMAELSKLPSTYDTGRTLDDAFKTSKVPVLIEFYADSCMTCRRLAPIMHEVTESYGDKITPVMLDVANEDTKMVAELFGLEELPGVYVFDTKHMKKEQITSEYFLTSKTLAAGIDDALTRIASRVETEPTAKTPPPLKNF